MRAAVALLAAALVAVPAADAYRNPTPGKAVVLQKPGMHRARVRHVVYQRSPRLTMDVYRARGARGRLPAVLLGGKNIGQRMGWAQLIAASGMTAVAFDIRSDDHLRSPQKPSQDVASAIAYVRSHAKRLGIDPNRLCTLGFADTAPWHLWATMRDPQPWLRCNVVYYGPLDGLPDGFSALTYLRREGVGIPPMLVVEAGRDSTAGTNDSIDRFAAEAAARHADVRVLAYPQGARGFDVGPRTTQAKAVVRRTLRYLQTRLAPPLRLFEPCATSTELTSTLRFFASDDTPLAGVLLGSGPRGLVLAHGQGGDICEWLPYARDFAAGGYRVLVYDARSGLRVDLDQAAAVEALRRAGSEHVIAMGSSMGAIASLIGSASLASAPAAVVSLSAPASFGPLNALQAVTRLQAPTFFGASEQDDPFVGDARALYSASAASDKRLDVLPGAAHGSALLRDPAFRSRVEAFIASH